MCALPTPTSRRRATDRSMQRRTTHTQGRCTMGATGCSYLPTRSALARPAQQPQTSRIERPRSSVQSASSSLLLAQLQRPWAEATM